MLYHFSPEFQRAIHQGKGGIQLRISNQNPRQSGLGRSSTLVLLILVTIIEMLNLDKRKYNKYRLAELAQRVEAKELGIKCGYADRYIPLFGGLAYLDYRQKLFQRDIFEEPYATVEKFPSETYNLPLVVVTIGITNDSGDIYSVMRNIFLSEQSNQVKNDVSPLTDITQKIYKTAWKGKITLLKGDLTGLGQLMNRNHALIDRMMRNCGFPDGAGHVNNALVQSACQAGALGAKLTGAGDGGSIFALTYPGDCLTIAQKLKNAAYALGCSNPRILLTSIPDEGALVEYSQDAHHLR
jgi:galactokinase/mevalonate kinase-like predicted kinase